MSMKFKNWLTKEGFTEPVPLGDIARRGDLVTGGENGCEDVPMGMKSVCQRPTSAFHTDKLPQEKRRRKKKFRGLG